MAQTKNGHGSKSRSGCITCKTRRVKCDETKPRCIRCRGMHLECGGYIVVGKQKPRHAVQQLMPLLPKIPALSTADISSSSFSLARKLSWLLEEDNDLGLKIQSLGTFLTFVPSRIGYSKALDDATECICSTYISLLQPGDPRSGSNRHKYLRSLMSLRQCMQHESQVLSSNVLAAAVLLSWYEILGENLDNSWLAHIRGCAKLIQLRGPSRQITEFDRALLDAEEGFISVEAMISCIPSFLDSPAWQSALKCSEDMPCNKDWYFQSLKIINLRVARISTIFSDFNRLMDYIRQDIHDVTEIRAILNRYEALRNEIRDHLEKINHMPRLGADERRRYILLVKLYLGLLTLDAHLFDFLSLLGPYSSLDGLSFRSLLATICRNNDHEPSMRGESQQSQAVCYIGFATSSPVAPDIDLSTHLPFIDILSHSRILKSLDASIASSTASLMENVILFKRADPFGSRRMTFLVRVFCIEARKRGSAHKSWEEIEVWLDRLNREDFLA